MKQISKKDKVLNYLKNHKKGISGKTAWEKFGLYRLSSAIYELREEGYDIRMEMQEKEVDGRTERFGVYYLYG